ncbi:alpha-E domain-containing protein [Arenicella xantha]|uniref:Putative alpha-E superfamily protein n=1 Tax=Arenicella xantha TaxID=644221 RepID=A0A395JSN9_9GAMM|nr:alpha-E domain-containing protein [Arenicella xantha]RBP51720.1 putative alpha-E superfamily protein [Arenicella xantha]
MLSRNAESLFWASRYMERADTMARNLEVGYRMSMMPAKNGGYTSEWKSILTATSTLQQFQESYSEISEENVESFLVYDNSNFSSIRSCLRMARDNARQVRTAITRDTWLAFNQAYLEFKDFDDSVENRVDLPTICDWVKRQASMVRGAFINTQLQTDGYSFFNLGYYVERADNTARSIDIKYHVLLPTIDMLGGSIDNYQWSTLLRSLGAYRSFHWAYGGEYSPDRIADFLILNRSCPRSLCYCIEKITLHLEQLCSSYGKYTPAQTHAMRMLDELRTISVNKIIANGLHEYLMQFVQENNHLAERIGESFLFGER